MNRGAPLKRGSMSRRPTPRRTHEQREVANAKKLLWVRSGGLCEMCSRKIEEGTFEFAHRQQKGMGGRGLNTASNGLASCPGPDGCNQKCGDGRYSRREVVYNGWIIPRGVIVPSDVAVLVAGKWWLLNDDGTKEAWNG